MREGVGREYMDKIRSVVASMKAEEARLLAQRSAELNASSRKTRVVLVIGEMLGLVFLGVAGVITQKEMVQRRRAEEEVRKLNVDLERKVAERTTELAERATDLGRSNMELQQFCLRGLARFTRAAANGR